MRARRLPTLDQRGWTLVEVMIVSAILGLIIPIITLFFMRMQEGMAADEMHTKLKELNETTMGRLNVRIRSCKHMFQDDPGGFGQDFLGLVNLTAGSPRPPAPGAAGVTLAAAQPASISSFTTGADQGLFGNAIFFAGYDSPTTVQMGPDVGKTFTAPLTVFGASVTYSWGGPATVILDVYRFYLYYLTAARKPLTNITTHGLVEWRSKQFVDYYQLDSIVDSDLKNAVIAWLTASSPPAFNGGPINVAWNPSKADPTDAAFIDLPALTETVTPAIPMQDWNYLTRASSGILSTGFRYGICGNNQFWPDRPKLVPVFAAENGEFPGGFEVGLLGRGGGLQVLTRSLLVAKGLPKRVVWNDVTMVHNARDIW